MAPRSATVALVSVLGLGLAAALAGALLGRRGRPSSFEIASGQGERDVALPVPPGGPVATTQTPEQWAAANGIDPAMVRAVVAVESGGVAPIGPRGPVIRFEVHKFLPRVRGAARTEADLVFRRKPGGLAWEHEWRPTGAGAWMPLHNGRQDREHDAFDLARRISDHHGYPDAAYQSISMGTGQIMGFHFAALGYPSAAAMYQDAHTIAGQHRQHVGFIAADPRLVKALKERDFFTFAAIYNTGSPTPQGANLDKARAYEAKLRGAYQRAIA
jgi:hypothetical protein